MAAAAGAAVATPAALSMKLLIDTRAQRVLFAEAGKDVIDFLFSLLALPVGTVIKLLGRESMAGCVGNLYTSVENLHYTYLQPDATKDALLHPVVLSARRRPPSTAPSSDCRRRRLGSRSSSLDAITTSTT
uniref:Uncharacterized protein n=1 Tax=Oryza punctata TaxID=4537 RepID=A0A0E0JE69_ORYPU